MLKICNKFNFYNYQISYLNYFDMIDANFIYFRFLKDIYRKVKITTQILICDFNCLI